MELDGVLFDLVGLPGPDSGVGLNVDARKRLTLGVELVANPAMVFMDEPTSGERGMCISIWGRGVEFGLVLGVELLFNAVMGFMDKLGERRMCISVLWDVG